MLPESLTFFDVSNFGDILYVTDEEMSTDISEITPRYFHDRRPRSSECSGVMLLLFHC
jgi:hypothetical protein